MTVMLGGLILAFILIVRALPDGVGVQEAWEIAGATGKTQMVDWSFSWNDRYNFWSGILGATFLFLSYFGTDQSQVGRYLSGKTLRESRIGLIFNGFIKIPMQMLVLAVGVMVFVFYQFERAPLHFNQANLTALEGTPKAGEYQQMEQLDNQLFGQKKLALEAFRKANLGSDKEAAKAAIQEIQLLEKQHTDLRKDAQNLVKTTGVKGDGNDKDYVFIRFVLSHIPVGLVGLMLAMIFCASWSTTASELSALSATSVSDVYRRLIAPGKSDAHYLKVSRISTVVWGTFIVAFAYFASLAENLIQAVNMIGSMFYGTILGIFFTAFFLKKVKGRAVFYAAILTEGVVLICFGINKDAFLWYNPLGCFLVMGLSWIVERVAPQPE
ncbi:MAG: hypothetical protein JNN28_18915 [Saprospiraceae bacterium]|nr:hypothetical protein [Saprospiraceae bacterium]